MAKKITGKVKLELEAGKANPAPPVGPALGQHGVNIMEFCKAYNAQTAELAGQIIPVEISIYEDRSFTFVLKKPPVAFLIRKTLNIPKGAATPNKTILGTLSQAQLREIAETKLVDMNVNGDVEAAMRIVAGTARSMGVKVAAD